METKKLKIGLPTQGWKQFRTARKEMLAAFDAAKEKSEGHKVKVNHGRVAEAEFRKWLTSFLPKRYAVSPGYIVTQGLDDKGIKLRGFYAGSSCVEKANLKKERVKLTFLYQKHKSQVILGEKIIIC